MPDLKLDPVALARFFYWINERHSIYLKRTAEAAWPWTTDPILQEYKFTNVFRELDTGTVWYRENWREPYADHTELFFNTCLYRHFNWWETADVLGFQEDWDPIKVETTLRERKAAGHRIFTNAHMLTGTLGGDKITQVVHKVLTPLWHISIDIEPTEEDTLESVFKRLLPNPGFGPFLSYEIVTDLRHTRYLSQASDIMTWANPGPGAMRGIRRILIGHNAKDYKSGIKKSQYIDIMKELLYLSDEFLEDHVPDLEMRDIEHSLCEFDKYERVRSKEGRPRMKFIPPHHRK